MNGSIIQLQLTNETFDDNSLGTQNFELQNAPSGCLINSITYQTATTCQVELSFDNTNFDTDITNFGIIVSANELAGTANLQSNTLTITAINESAPSAELSSAQELNESNLNGSVLSISLTNETFVVGGRDGGEFILQNAPDGLSLGTPIFSSDNTEVELPLVFDGTDFTEDILDFNIQITKGMLTGNSYLITNSLTIHADVVQAITTTEKTNSIKLFPNPGSGRFYLQLSDDFTGKILIKIMSLEGKCVFEENIQKLASENVFLNLQNLKSGSYFLSLNTNQKHFIKTLIIEKK